MPAATLISLVPVAAAMRLSALLALRWAGLQARQLQGGLLPFLVVCKCD
jgi:hypothetical protein